MNRFLLAAFFSLGVFVPLADAQFNPGPNPISGATTAAQTLAGGTGTITSTGSLTVSGSSVAVTMSGGTAGNPTTLSNSGVINQTGTGRAIRSIVANSNLLIQNLPGGMISATADDTIAVGSGTIHNISVALTNAGTITGKGGNQGVNFGNLTSGTNSITNSGTITATAADAVRPGTNGTVVNTGTIMSTQVNGSGSDGVDAQTNSGVQITNSSANAATNSIIEGGRHGITGGNTDAAVNNGAFVMSITNFAKGTIQGDNGAGINIDGINANEVVTIVNNGTIIGNGITLANPATSQDGDGVDVDGLVNLTNAGTIRSLNAINDTSEGVTVGGGTITNSGTIQGSVSNSVNNTAAGRGITIAGVDKDASGNSIPVQAPYAATTITNSGLIKGDSEAAIAYTSTLTSGFTHTINNQAGGTLEGGGAVAAVRLGPDNDIVNNAGAIIADTSGKALDMGGGNNTLNITGGGASISGDISGGTGGTNALTFDPGAGNKFSYAGAISNFNSAEVKSGTVNLSGASTYSGNTTISGGTLLANNTTGSATGTGGVTIQNGGALGGSGHVGGNVTLQSGGAIAPGNSPGTLSLDSNLTIMSGSQFTFELAATNAASDHLVIAGGLIFAGAGQAIVNILHAGVMAGVDYTLMSFTSSTNLSAANFAFGSVPTQFIGNFIVTSNEVRVHVSQVPDSGSTLMFLLVAASLAFALRPRDKFAR